MKVVVVIDSTKAPCIVASLRQVRLHIEAATWCDQNVVISSVFQVPDDSRTCDACAIAIAKWSGK